jgi:hypothetical protein
MVAVCRRQQARSVASLAEQGRSALEHGGPGPEGSTLMLSRSQTAFIQSSSRPIYVASLPVQLKTTRSADGITWTSRSASSTSSGLAVENETPC